MVKELAQTFLLLIFSSLLFWNLYYQPLDQICRSQHDKLLSGSRLRNRCPIIRNILSSIKKINTTSKSTLNYTHPCQRIEIFRKELQKLHCSYEILNKIKSTSNHQNSLKTLANIYTASIYEKDIFYGFSHLNSNYNLIKIFKLLNEIYTNTSVKPALWESSVQGKTIFLTKLALRTDYMELDSGFEKINQIRVKMMDSSSVLTDKIEIFEMKSVLDFRDELREAVFFTETSGTGVVKARFVCAVESAARAYPNGDVYLLVSYIPEEGLLKHRNIELAKVLEYNKNIKVLEVIMDKLFMGSPLEKLYLSGKLNESKFLAAHTSDMVRILAVYMYGGKYFDLDIVTVKNLTGIRNFIIPESDGGAVANGAFAYEKKSGLGDIMFKMLNQKFDANAWAENGPGVFSRAVRNYTGTYPFWDFSKDDMKEFKKLKYRTLFPIDYFELDLYFDTNKVQEAMEKIEKYSENLWGMHIGNNIAKQKVVRIGENQAYGLIAQQFCPRSYWSCFTEF